MGGAGWRGSGQEVVSGRKVVGQAECRDVTRYSGSSGVRVIERLTATEPATATTTAQAFAHSYAAMPHTRTAAAEDRCPLAARCSDTPHRIRGRGEPRGASSTRSVQHVTYQVRVHVLDVVVDYLVRVWHRVDAAEAGGCCDLGSGGRTAGGGVRVRMRARMSVRSWKRVEEERE